ncbi:MAG: hypothetical protein IIB25_00570, partial [Chloroflexi bacterium]|nr:hypothetical protein [Chloroflexota bacterium]
MAAAVGPGVASGVGLAGPAVLAEITVLAVAVVGTEAELVGPGASSL